MPVSTRRMPCSPVWTVTLPPAPDDHGHVAPHRQDLYLSPGPARPTSAATQDDEHRQGSACAPVRPGAATRARRPRVPQTRINFPRHLRGPNPRASALQGAGTFSSWRCTRDTSFPIRPASPHTACRTDPSAWGSNQAAGSGREGSAALPLWAPRPPSPLRTDTGRRRAWDPRSTSSWFEYAARP